MTAFRRDGSDGGSQPATGHAVALEQHVAKLLARLMDCAESDIDLDVSLLELHDVVDSLGMLELIVALDAELHALQDPQLTIRTLVGDAPQRAGAHRWLADPGRAVTAAGSAAALCDPVPGDYPFLHSLALDPDAGARWRYRATVPPPEVFVSNMWVGVFEQATVVDVVSGVLCGHVVAHELDLANRHCDVAVLSGPHPGARSIVADGLLLFLDLLLAKYPFRRIYFRLPEIYWEATARGLRDLGDVEGRLVNHHFVDGRLMAEIVVAIKRPPGERDSLRDRVP